MSRIYLDTCIVIYLLEASLPADCPIAQELSTLGYPDNRLVVSELTRLECRVKPLRDSNLPLLEAYENFFHLDNVEFVELNRAVCDRATELRAYEGLRTPDALHVAAALISGCDSFWTNDSDLLKLDKLLQIYIPGG